MADGLLHGAFEGLVGGGDGQEEVFGAGLPLWEQPLVPPRLPTWSERFPRSSSPILLLSSWWGGDDGVEEGNGGRREEAGGWELHGSCDEAKEVL